MQLSTSHSNFLKITYFLLHFPELVLFLENSEVHQASSFLLGVLSQQQLGTVLPHCTKITKIK